LSHTLSIIYPRLSPLGRGSQPSTPQPSTARASLRLWPPSLRLPYGSFFDSAFKIISIFANSKIATPITANDCKGFTGRMSKIPNLFAGPYGFTAKNPQGWGAQNFVDHFVPHFAVPRQSDSSRHPVAPKSDEGGSTARRRESDVGGSRFASPPALHSATDEGGSHVVHTSVHTFSSTSKTQKPPANTALSRLLHLSRLKIPPAGGRKFRAALVTPSSVPARNCSRLH
jgi:hypothetical protein